MSSVQLLKNGDLTGSLKKLQAEIRDAPQEPKHRVFLFQLLCVLGQWDRALTQLNVLRDLDKNALSMVQAYQETLVCEALRTAVFAGQRSPLLFGEPEQWMALMLEALKQEAAGQPQAAALREQALEAAPPSPGQVTLHPTDQTSYQEPHSFQWMADADSRIGPFLEAIVNGKYYWIPLQRVRSVAFEKVADLRDMVWLPTRFTWNNGGDAVGFVPTRYAGSEASTDDSLRFGRSTQWQELAAGNYRGLGQRVLTTDQDELALTQIAKIDFTEASLSDAPSTEEQHG